MDTEFYIREQLASVLKGFKDRDYSSIFSALEQERDRLLDRCGTANEKDFVSLAFYLTAITLADLKQIPVDATDEFVIRAFAHIDADPSLLVTSVAGYAGRCRAEGRRELGRIRLRMAVEYMDVGNHWAKLSPAAEPAIRSQLAALET